MADEANLEQVPAVDVPDTNYEAVLAEYHREQLLSHMIGPVLSLFVHVVVMTLLAVVVKGDQGEQITSATVEIKELNIENVEQMEPLAEPEVTETTQEIERSFDESASVSDMAPTSDVIAAPGASEGAGVGGGSDIVGETIGDAGPTSEGGGGDAEFSESGVSAIASASPLKIAGIGSLYANRGSGARVGAVKAGGGSSESQDAVEKALQWLQSVQRPDGSWEGDAARTGLALLVFLARGETPLSEKYSYTVQNGMQWLSAHMMALGTDQMAGGNVYSHGIATYAMAEAYGMTRIPGLRGAMEKGLERIIRGQQAGGGFNYGYDKGARWDLSVGGWQIQAMKAGIATGAQTPGLHEAAKKAMEWVKRDTFKNGKFGYSSAGSGGNMTGVGTVCLQLLGDTKGKEVRAAAETISTERLATYQSFVGDKGKDFEREATGLVYGWYYDTQAMFNVGGKTWKEWNKVFQKVLIKAQNTGGYWDFRETAASHYGSGNARRVLITCWCALQLEVYYRYLPTFDISKMMRNEKAPKASSSVLDDISITVQ